MVIVPYYSRNNNLISKSIMALNTEKYKLYTKGGDKGKTSLVGGKRVAKHCTRIESYGSIDELNSFIGVLLSHDLLDEDVKTLEWIQQKLFSVGSYLATDPQQTEFRMESRITEQALARIEGEIDRLNDAVPPLNAFILPSGGPTSAAAHVCRSVCRRAERAIYRLHEEEPVGAEVLCYINRLSDYFFALARKESYRLNTKETTWKYDED